MRLERSLVSMLILTEPDLRSVLKTPDVIIAVERGFRAMARGDTVVPWRLRLGVPGADAVLSVSEYHDDRIFLSSR
jgi:hypothetical protein